MSAKRAKSATSRPARTSLTSPSKTLADFDFGFQPSLDERQVRELATLASVQQGSAQSSSRLQDLSSDGRAPVRSL
ncbi:MAG: ATP-binding protein [Armatimonadota bacterium]|nr:ATP-binding protein [Armatimonadota bacterium]